MKKKIFAMFLSIVMMLSLLPMTAFAAGDEPVWSVDYDKGAKAVVVTVNGETQKFTSWKNNQAEEYKVNGWIISATVKGNAIDKKALVGPVATPVVPLDVVAAESSTPSNSQIIVDAETRIWQDGFGFHCNVNGGNGATDVINLRTGTTVKKGNQKDVFGTKSFPVTLVRVGTTTLWNLITDEIECATCGSKEWVTYSNNSGVINGKNIQVHHRSYAQIAKVWTDENPNGLEAIFDIYKYDSTKDDGRGELVLEGALPDVKFQLEPGTYVVAERAKIGYKIQDDIRLTLEEGKTTIFSFKNEPNDVEKYGALSIQKTVDGAPFYQWAKDNDLTSAEIMEIIGGMEFTAYLLTGENGTRTATSYPCVIDGNGVIDFGKDLIIGWYEIEEKISGTTLTYFVGEGESKIVYVGEGGISHETANIISGIDQVGTIISHNGTGVNWPLPKVWNDRLANEPYFQDLLNMGAQWIWDAEDTYKYGYTGSVVKFDFTVGVEEETMAPIIFAADNAAVIYVNGELAAFTDVAFEGRGIPQTIAPEVTADTFFDSLEYDQFDGRWDEGWARVYKKDITLSAGENKITIFAANSASTNPEYTGNPATSTDNDYYDLTNNPCGVIFGFQLPGVNFDNAAFQRYANASFNKEAVGEGVDLTQFAFDLFKYNEETDEYNIRIPYEALDPETNMPVSGDGYYYPNEYGTVFAGNLEIGKYVFKEIDTGIWAPRGYENGLFFEIAREDVGLVVTWDLADGEDVDDAGNPIVVNEKVLGNLEVTASVTAQHERITYEPVYEKLTDKNSTDTLVSYRNHSETTGNSTNQFSYKIDLSKPEGRVAIAISNGNNNTPTGIGQYYTYKVVGNELVVSLDENVIKADVGIDVKTSPDFKNGHPGGGNPGFRATLGETTGVYSMSITLPDSFLDGEYIYLYLHIASGITWYTGEQKVVGYEEVVRETVTDTYDGELTVTLNDAEGNEVDSKPIANNGSVTFEGLVPGEYTCILSGDGFDDNEETVIIVAGTTEEVEFTVNVTNPVVEIGKTPEIGTIIPKLTTFAAPLAQRYNFSLVNLNINELVPLGAPVITEVESVETETVETETVETETEESDTVDEDDSAVVEETDAIIPNEEPEAE